MYNDPTRKILGHRACAKVSFCVVAKISKITAGRGGGGGRGVTVSTVCSNYRGARLPCSISLRVGSSSYFIFPSFLPALLHSFCSSIYTELNSLMEQKCPRRVATICRSSSSLLFSISFVAPNLPYPTLPLFHPWIW